MASVIRACLSRRGFSKNISRSGSKSAQHKLHSARTKDIRHCDTRGDISRALRASQTVSMSSSQPNNASNERPSDSKEEVPIVELMDDDVEEDPNVTSPAYTIKADRHEDLDNDEDYNEEDRKEAAKIFNPTK